MRLYSACNVSVNIVDQSEKKLIIFEIMITIIHINIYLNIIYIVLNYECQIVKMSLISVNFAFAL